MPFWGRPGGDLKFDGKTRHFEHFGRQFLDSVANSDGKTPNGQRALAETQRESWVFRPSHPGSEIIRTNIYISTNYIAGWVEGPKTPRLTAAFGEHSRGNGPFSAGIRNTIEDRRSKAAKVTYFTVHFGTDFRGGPYPATLSGIGPCRALWPANGATRRKRGRENAVLSERRLRRSRARGAVRFRTRHPSRGSGNPARGTRVNLRDI